MSLKRSTEDQVIAYNQRDTRRWCRGVVGREHAYDLADAYARDACGMEQRWWLQQFPWLADAEPESESTKLGMECVKIRRRYWVVACENCGRRDFFYRQRYLRGAYDSMVIRRD